MTAWTITRQSQRADSKTGGKDYHLVMITDDSNGRSLLVSRWAKAGQWGNGMKVECFETRSEANRAWAALDRAKFQGEYREILINRNEKKQNSFADLKKTLGQYWAKLGTDNLNWLIPGADTTGVREPTEAVWDDKEKRYVTPRRAGPVERQPDPPPAVEDMVKDNPLWGSW